MAPAWARRRAAARRFRHAPDARPAVRVLSCAAALAAEFFQDRTDVQCLHRWQKVLNPELVKGPWTAEVRRRGAWSRCACLARARARARAPKRRQSARSHPPTGGKPALHISPVAARRRTRRSCASWVSWGPRRGPRSRRSCRGVSGSSAASGACVRARALPHWRTRHEAALRAPRCRALTRGAAALRQVAQPPEPGHPARGVDGGGERAAAAGARLRASRRKKTALLRRDAAPLQRPSTALTPAPRAPPAAPRRRTPSSATAGRRSRSCSWDAPTTPSKTTGTFRTHPTRMPRRDMRTCAHTHPPHIADALARARGATAGTRP
jgi:hypothetical protein